MLAVPVWNLLGGRVLRGALAAPIVVGAWAANHEFVGPVARIRAS